MSDNFHRAHAFTAHWEGGFSDHPADTGGLTAYGASLKFVQGIAATQQGRDWLQRIGFRLPVNKASMRSVTPDMAEAMFKREFWARLRPVRRRRQQWLCPVRQAGPARLQRLCGPLRREDRGGRHPWAPDAGLAGL